MCLDFDQRISDLEANMAIVMGRANALHTLLTVVTQALPANAAAQCAAHVREAAARIDADILALPFADPMRAEMKRVLADGVAVLDAAAADKA
jgi:hypothetical protein